MKTKIISATIALPLVFALASCRKETTTDTTVEKVSAGAEKAAEGVKEMADAAGTAAGDAAAAVEETAADAGAAVEETAAGAGTAVKEAAADALEGAASGVKEKAEEVEVAPPTLPE